MKKVLSFMLASFTALTLASCGNKDKSESNTPEDAIRNWAKVRVEKDNAEEFLKCIMPEDQMKQMKDDGYWDEYSDYHNNEVRECIYFKDIVITVKDIYNKTELSKDELSTLTKLYTENDCDVEIKEAYQFDVALQVDEDGEKSIKKGSILVVDFKGEGWKVLEQLTESVIVFDGLTIDEIEAINEEIAAERLKETEISEELQGKWLFYKFKEEGYGNVYTDNESYIVFNQDGTAVETYIMENGTEKKNSYNWKLENGTITLSTERETIYKGFFEDGDLVLEAESVDAKMYFKKVTT